MPEAPDTFEQLAAAARQATHRAVSAAEALYRAQSEYRAACAAEHAAVDAWRAAETIRHAS